MATNLNTSTLPEMSRRKFAKSAAALVGAAGLIGGAGAAFAASHPDAELLEMGRQLVALSEEYAAKSEDCDRANAAWVPPQPAESLKVTSADLALIGVPGTASNRHWTHWAIKQKLELMRDNPQAVARLTELHRYADEAGEVFCRSRVECGLEAAAERQGEVCERIDAVSAHIRALPATTFQGLAVKAFSLTFYTSLWDENPDDMDWDQFCIREFATEVLRSYLGSTRAGLECGRRGRHEDSHRFLQRRKGALKHWQRREPLAQAGGSFVRACRLDFAA